jgi:hypothetical protein
MSELRLAANFLAHPKFIELERLAPAMGLQLWLGMLTHCNLNLTDGIVSVEQVRYVYGPTSRWRQRALRALMTVGLVEQLDATSLLVHDYLEWNPSRRAVLMKREARRKNRPDGSESREGAPTDTANACRDTLLTRAEIHSERVPTYTANACRPTLRPPSQSNDDGQLSLKCCGQARNALARAPASPSPSMSMSIQDPPLPSDGGHTEPVEKKSRQPRRVAGSIRSRCTADFEPDSTTLALATSLGFTIGLERKSRAEFVDYWIGEGKLKSDWQATYRNRLRKVAELRGLKPVVKSAPGPHSGPRIVSPAERYVPTQAEYREALAKVHQLFPG